MHMYIYSRARERERAPIMGMQVAKQVPFIHVPESERVAYIHIYTIRCSLCTYWPIAFCNFLIYTTRCYICIPQILSAAARIHMRNTRVRANCAGCIYTAMPIDIGGEERSVHTFLRAVYNNKYRFFFLESACGGETFSVIYHGISMIFAELHYFIYLWLYIK